MKGQIPVLEGKVERLLQRLVEIDNPAAIQNTKMKLLGWKKKKSPTRKDQSRWSPDATLRGMFSNRNDVSGKPLLSLEF
ncbi:hypothetical protein [Candidatus Nitrospira nitrosa]|uniref:hypothetical protein n=1 Tax=Candidatus Nitrospira nitrosa TaxID=1742972 RepID=UPI0011478E5F|nr:hypothetical protein [Candidatus Nitrospira nitrosa]